MAARALFLHHPPSWALPAGPSPTEGRDSQKRRPVLLSISKRGEGEALAFPLPGSPCWGGAGGRGDKGADVGDASTPIMEDGPTHTADLGWPAPLRQEMPLPQAPGATSLGSAPHAVSLVSPGDSSGRSTNNSRPSSFPLRDLEQVTYPLWASVSSLVKWGHEKLTFHRVKYETS